MYILVFGNCTYGVQILLKAGDLYKEQTCAFNYMRLLKTTKMIVSGIDMKISPHISLYAALMNFLLLKQYMDTSNDIYLTRFKSSVNTLNLAGGSHIFISKQMLGKDIASVLDKT